ncbi:hypothetical protein BU26DRAFT_191334 [Trematosphaeria pertusa]|uniref:Uncharacterized protein n=1 Tax=Trematosphaeria pertusa TaxID=390896 RepID=A0A6A6HS46_9PLEO|nr:uncharacterized protein BU26DRAFT_191334 [Trematosphaeria pertusa]KAF2240821.1 hypothetical protein BU26DRAFT_191334 [Trematosphaeria pertusa]
MRPDWKTQAKLPSELLLPAPCLPHGSRRWVVVYCFESVRARAASGPFATQLRCGNLVGGGRVQCSSFRVLVAHARRQRIRGRVRDHDHRLLGHFAMSALSGSIFGGAGVTETRLIGRCMHGPGSSPSQKSFSLRACRSLEQLLAACRVWGIGSLDALRFP